MVLACLFPILAGSSCSANSHVLKQPLYRGNVGMIGFITDCEGDYAYWSRCVAISRVIKFDPAGQLAFLRQTGEDFFVFGGDVFDKGPGDLRIAQQLVDFKRLHPARVFLLAGNRDLNKLRFPAELAEDDIDVPQPVPLYPRAPPQVSLRDFLEKRLEPTSDKTLATLNTRANRLRWILDHTMTATGAFEMRREEMALIAGQQVGSISDDDVVESFLTSVSKDDGLVSEYLGRSCLLVVIGDCLFVHGGLPKEAINWVPSMDMRYVQPEAGATCGGRRLEGALKEWVEAMNEFQQDRPGGSCGLACLGVSKQFWHSILNTDMVHSIASRVPLCLRTS